MPVRRARPPHPLDHHPSFRAVIAAGPPLAELVPAMPGADLVGGLAIACGDLAHGFAAPPGSRLRSRAHHRAWIAVRELERVVKLAKVRRLASPDVVARAERAIDRADVLISSLPGVLPV